MAIISAFDPKPPSMARQGDGWLWPVTLDPTEPYLADHQAGGCGVLGVVASLEIMAAGASQLADGWPLVGVEDLQLFTPVFVPAGVASPVSVQATSLAGQGSERRLRCALTSRGGEGETLHMQCTLIFRADRPAAGEPVAPGPRTGAAVAAQDIYKVFFHGPAFQVVARAWRQGDRMVAELARPLRDWTTTGGPTVAAPRLIEFGMQAAGLLHLASDRAMLIPHQIDRIVRHTPTDVDADHALFAIVDRRGPEVGSPTDVVIVDAGGRVHMRIAGYRCVAVTADLDHGAIAELADCFRNP